MIDIAGLSSLSLSDRNVVAASMTGCNDADGVVNPDGTVKGITGLRVADASIMPSDCRANTHFTTVVIGEAIAKTMIGRAKSPGDGSPVTS